MPARVIFNLTIDVGASYSLTTLANFDVNGTLTLLQVLDISSNTITVSGATDIDGTLKLSTGIFDANGSFTASVVLLHF